MGMRTVSSEDLDAIYSLYMHDSINPYMLHEAMEKEAFKPLFQKMMGKDAFWAYENEGRVIGMCSCEHGEARISHLAQIHAFAIDPAYQGKGHAKKFLQAVIGDLAQKGFRRVDLWAEADNTRALGFYKSIGFQEHGCLPDGFKRANSNEYVDEIILSKPLNT
jgi:ribosomal protein S18 acetylase RimI-like enzyme